MINSSEFAERLKKVMDYYQLSPSAFADRIKVQRSSISHLISGRNKPSLDFVLKVIKEFKEVELYWLLNGKGSFPGKPSTPTTALSQNKKMEQPLEILKSVSGKKTIERIVMFYTDGTFKEYTK